MKNLKGIQSLASFAKELKLNILTKTQENQLVGGRECRRGHCDNRPRCRCWCRKRDRSTNTGGAEWRSGNIIHF